MPVFGIGLHVLVALFFAIHAVRTGRELYWLMILFFFPLLGSVVYFFAVYLPDTRLDHGVRKMASAAAKSLDPGRELRDALEAYELTPTAQNQMRLANALLERGDTTQAARHYEACLRGPFANDPEILLGAAKASLLNGQATTAIELIEKLRNQNAQYREEQTSLVLAQAYAKGGLTQQARHEFESVVKRFGSLEAQVEYAIWARRVGENHLASTLYNEIQHSMRHWKKHNFSLNRQLIERLETAFSEK